MSRQPQTSYHARDNIKRKVRAAMPRDNISQAFAGTENYGHHSSPNDHKHSTNVKSRRTKESKYRTPKR